MKKLDITSLPISGLRLIEASAGTGKTYTIANIFLRLLLEKRLPVSQVLVVTFTVAATEELRSRIRQRIQQALEYMSSPGTGADNDLVAIIADKQHDENAILYLKDVLANIDEASIFTIHGLCQRILADSAFESGALFESVLVADDYEYKIEIMRDYWRNNITRLEQNEAAWLHDCWRSPETLLQTIQGTLSENVKITPQYSDQEIHAQQDEMDRLLEVLKQSWSESSVELIELMNASKSLSRRESTWRQDKLENAFTQVSDFLKHPVNVWSLPDTMRLFGTSMLEDPDLLKGKKEPVRHVLCDYVQNVCDSYYRLDKMRYVQRIQHVRAYLINELERRKAASHEMHFDDLLVSVSRAIQGENGKQLVSRIRKLYPIAMIDEFQDTDPLQYDIFSRIYSGSDELALYMIGDPKQAIYSFRGADIFTYMQAKKATDQDGKQYTLDTNWRSTSRYVDAVNAVFQSTDAPFVFHDEITFQPVKAAERDASLSLNIDEKEPAPLVIWYEGKEQEKRTKKQIMTRLADACASEIKRLLLLSDKGQAQIDGQKLQSRDFAILVRNRTEARYIKDALSKESLASIYLSRDSVFHTEECRDLLILLKAISGSSRPAAIRAALSIRMLGWDAQEIHQLNHDEQVLEELIERFHAYREAWLNKGFVSMMNGLLKQETVPATLLAYADGERRLTNLLQLIELASDAAVQHVGIEALITWLEQEAGNQVAGSDERELRLESDENLINIVTIHKSKGLEYPVVFLPFVWASKKRKDPELVRYHDKSSGATTIEIAPDLSSHTRTQQRNENFSEELRLLYVALTRAVYRCYLAWGDFPGASYSTLAWLMNTGPIPEDPIELQVEHEAVHAFAQACNERASGTVLIEPMPDKISQHALVDEKALAADARVFKRKLYDPWMLTSFTGITSKLEYLQNLGIERPDYDAVSELAVAEAGLDIKNRFSFPRGARAGECLHSLLEDIEFDQEPDKHTDAIIISKLTKYGFDQEWLPIVRSWLTDILATQLDSAQALTLSKIGADKKLVEMPFYYPVKQLKSGGFFDILSDLPIYKGQDLHLKFNDVQGLMKGFIDLIFEYEGKFYVLDYKSNYLGDRYSDYSCEKLSESMLEHHYEIQYMIYTIALHRYLSQVLQGYDYDMHFGGVYYLYLRGMSQDSGGKTGVYFARPDRQVVDRLNEYLAGEVN